MAEKKSVECDLCGIESTVPEERSFAVCKNCNNRVLCPPIPDGHKYIRYSCCSTFYHLRPSQSEIKCLWCWKINLLTPEIAEIRCKQPVYASKLKVPYTEDIANLKKSLETAEEEKKKAIEELERTQVEVEKQRQANEIQKQMIESLKQTNKDQFKGFLQTMKEYAYENNLKQPTKAKPVIDKQKKNDREGTIVANPYSRLRPRQPKEKPTSS